MDEPTLKRPSTKQVKKAGRILSKYPPDSTEYHEACRIVDDHRRSHAKALNTFQATLRNKVKKLSLKNAIIAQRLKRFPTILNKLKRHSGMDLSRMQDIGGLRVIVSSIDEMYKVYHSYTKNTKRFTHELCCEKDYCQDPKSSGYRGLHLGYKYKSKHAQTKEYDGLRVEIQIRTQLQHIWATAVETFEVFLGEKYKFSQGNGEILQFFKNVASLMAMDEGQPVLPEHSEDDRQSLVRKVFMDIKRLKIGQRLGTFTNFRSSGKIDKKSIVVLILDPDNKTTVRRSYSANMEMKAISYYNELEQKYSNNDAVQVLMVKMRSIKELEDAYPNYFANITAFRDYLKKIAEEYAGI